VDDSVVVRALRMAQRSGTAGARPGHGGGRRRGAGASPGTLDGGVGEQRGISGA
jgi:alpha/beta superfamily hydrolase